MIITPDRLPIRNPIIPHNILSFTLSSLPKGFQGPSPDKCLLDIRRRCLLVVGIAYAPRLATLCCRCYLLKTNTLYRSFSSEFYAFSETF